MRTQRQVIADMTAKRIARGAEQHDMAQLERFYNKYGEDMPEKYSPPDPDFCIECGARLTGIELNKKNSRCLECEHLIKNERGEADRKRRKAYMKKYFADPDKKPKHAIKKKKKCRKCGAEFTALWPNQTHCSAICSYKHKKMREREKYYQRAMGE